MKDDFHKQISVDVGAAIREQRLAAGLSQDQLAEAIVPIWSISLKGRFLPLTTNPEFGFT